MSPCRFDINVGSEKLRWLPRDPYIEIRSCLLVGDPAGQHDLQTKTPWPWNCPMVVLGARCGLLLHGRTRWSGRALASPLHALNASHSTQSIQSILLDGSGDLTYLLLNPGHLKAGRAKPVRDIFDPLSVLAGYGHHDVNLLLLTDAALSRLREDGISGDLGGGAFDVLVDPAPVLAVVLHLGSAFLLVSTQCLDRPAKVVYLTGELGNRGCALRRVLGRTHKHRRWSDPRSPVLNVATGNRAHRILHPPSRKHAHHG